MATHTLPSASGTTRPATETTAAGPFENWPTGLGFEYFYGFLAGEASQYEPNLVRNTTCVLPPRDARGGLPPQRGPGGRCDRLAAPKHKAFQPDKPFFMYWASGAIHGPHHVMKEWADKYKGKFDDGWDAYRERVFSAPRRRAGFPPTRSSRRVTDTMAVLGQHSGG